MQQTLFLFFTFFLSTFSLNAQQLDWGPDYEEPANTIANKIVGVNPDGFYLIREKNRGDGNAKPRAWVERYDRSMKMLHSEEIELKHKGKVRDFEDVLYLGRQLYLLTSFNNTAKKRNHLFRQTLDPQSLLPSKTLDMIADTEARNKEVEGTFGFVISKDSTKLLIYNDLPYDKDQPERFGLRVFNERFEKVWEKNIVLPYTDNRFTVEESRVDEQGNVFMLCVLYEDDAKWRRRGKPTYKYVVLAYPVDGSEPQEIRIDGTDKFITDLTFRVGNDGKLVCTGFYSERGTYSIKGTFFFHLDAKTREISNRAFSEFSFDFLTEFMSDRQVERAKEAERKNDTRRSPEMYNYSLDELILRSDGGAVLVAEQFFIEQQQDYSYSSPYGFYGGYSPMYYNRSNNFRTDYIYNYNDIVVVNIRPTGEIEWAARIPKRQETENDGGYYSSYSMCTVRDKLFFIFNDHVRNYDPERKPNKFYSYSGRDAVIVLAEVSKNGEVSARPLASNRDADVITRPKMCKQIGRREMALLGERGRGFRFASLKFE